MPEECRIEQPRDSTKLRRCCAFPAGPGRACA